MYEPAFAALTVVDFSDVAQGCKTYDEFVPRPHRLGRTACTIWGLPSATLEKLVNKLTGSLPLLR